MSPDANYSAGLVAGYQSCIASARTSLPAPGGLVCLSQGAIKFVPVLTAHTGP